MWTCLAADKKGRTCTSVQSPTRELSGWAALYPAASNNALFGAKLPVERQQEARLKDGNERKKWKEAEQ